VYCAVGGMGGGGCRQVIM